MSRPLLEVRGLTVAYGPIVAVHGIDLRVDEGEVVALVGANGAGKTTTLRTIAGLLRPREGAIVFDGERVAGRRPHRLVRRGLVLVPEGRGILARLSVEENLLLAASGRSRAPGEALEATYERFPVLHERRRQAGGTLSGGEQQMLALGRALVAGARLLMLDEPSLGLAPLAARAVFATIEELKQERVTILLVEQNARAALEIAGRSYLMETGRIVREGSGDELLSDEDVVRAYLGTGRQRRRARDGGA